MHYFERMNESNLQLGDRRFDYHILMIGLYENKTYTRIQNIIIQRPHHSVYNFQAVYSYIGAFGATAPPKSKGPFVQFLQIRVFRERGGGLGSGSLDMSLLLKGATPKYLGGPNLLPAVHFLQFWTQDNK